jgi:hypothetical protein
MDELRKAHAAFVKSLTNCQKWRDSITDDNGDPLDDDYSDLDEGTADWNEDLAYLGELLSDEVGKMLASYDVIMS